MRRCTVTVSCWSILVDRLLGGIPARRGGRPARRADHRLRCGSLPASRRAGRAEPCPSALVYRLATAGGECHGGRARGAAGDPRPDVPPGAWARADGVYAIAESGGTLPATPRWRMDATWADRPAVGLRDRGWARGAAPGAHKGATEEAPSLRGRLNIHAGAADGAGRTCRIQGCPSTLPIEGDGEGRNRTHLALHRQGRQRF